DLHFVEINDCNQAFNRMSVAIVIGVRPDPGERSGKTLRILLLSAVVVASRPGINHEEIKVGNASLTQGLLELGAGLDGLFAFKEFVEHDRGLDSRNVLP